MPRMTPPPQDVEADIAQPPLAEMRSQRGELSCIAAGFAMSFAAVPMGDRCHCEEHRPAAGFDRVKLFYTGNADARGRNLGVRIDRTARMKVVFELGRFCLAIAVVGLLFYGYQYSMSQGMQAVIASQPPMPAFADPPAFDTFQDCEVIPLYGSRPAKPPCQFKPFSPLPEPAPIHTMSKAESQKASGWFLLSGLALPLAFGTAALLGYLLLKRA